MCLSHYGNPTIIDFPFYRIDSIVRLLYNVNTIGGEHMSAREKHLKMVEQNNVVIAMDNGRYMVVHSKRTVKPLLPFEITEEVFNQWKQRDSRIANTETPFSELFTATICQHKLGCVANFDDIEFSEN